RLLLVTLGALAAAVEPLALLVALAAVGLLCGWIVVVRLHWSWWAAGPGSPYAGVRAVALDFDGTVADSMGFLTDLAVGLLVGEFCERHGLLQRFASVDGWGPRHTKSVQLVSTVAAAGFAGHEVVFVGDTRRDADVARAAGTRFVGLVRAGHPDALAGSGAKVVGSLSELAANLVQAVRCPLTREAHERDSVLSPAVEPGLSAFEGE